MLPKTHAIIGLIFSILIYFVFHIPVFYAALIFLASILIDFDHYLWYVLKNKDYSLNHAYYFFKEKRKKFEKLSGKEKKTYKMPYLIFHVLEFWIVLFLLSYLNKIFLFILLGIGIHMILDYVEIIYKKSVVYPKISLILTYLINNKRKKYLF